MNAAGSTQRFVLTPRLLRKVKGFRGRRLAQPPDDAGAVVPWRELVSLREAARRGVTRRVVV